ncbi:2-succinyl-5-enolpyruvyl-6-hydroxy-3-cyclohexene-1-carboxylic-acid synthase [Leuconostoc suionicum]|uniref:2-succinyl-5-enolpyruvyl-6-hydroxy-3- cyclohexene-1-carboxylic-acid synthase n=1 Tax=Leuconostoc suionicum TaxID=1511761 RepID=UPI00233E812B|nr:2-succinyl-5-enolpyruvyl-6-hydroxy-3-cyclohexene-1-carboxylic-acid synthase [Leuconostoc suionicum]MDC2805439.1 2-succinyl-5-enolpyruvyl-6-hydroxy-3-cyclohexene-1-carboxylic-acid synthase [Leuconostoc suionicum]MDC2822951.1 2-succinyl-5-enolpyruvyl-6-hydroxy-3-cyclohexene-1-carboxylic-acid synthase [Leuconostoc suionicum]
MTDTLTFNTKHLLQALFESGIRHFIMSPGSRSTPIALLLAEYAEQNNEIKLFVDVDERSAGFFALGIAKTLLEPVALLGTSGTAIAEYMPAVAEAYAANIPLVVLSTDRPQELQFNGAPQTIPQSNLFGQLTKQAVLIRLQDMHSDVTEYIDFMVQKVVNLSITAPCGPIQINLPLRKPLMPALARQDEVHVQRVVFEQQTVQYHLSPITAKRLLILAGPNVLDSYDDSLKNFAIKNNVPVIADVLSQSRHTYTIHGIDVLLQAHKINADLKPDLVVRFGKTPVSARVLQWLKEEKILTWHVDEDAGVDHTRHIARAIKMSPNDFLENMHLTPSKNQIDFNQKWLSLPKVIKARNEMNIITALDDAVPDDTHIFVANSMPIRDMDNFFTGNHTQRIYANRGANGIDGVISSALGMSAVVKQRSILLTGDLTLFHDMNGLMMAKNYQLPLDIIVINNNGGGIFSFLPQAGAPKYFEQLFGTPLNIDMKKIADLYDIDYHQLSVPEALSQILQTPSKTTRLIEYKSDRQRNRDDHRDVLEMFK